MKTLQEALVEQLKDLYSAESQLIDALPKMARGCESPELEKIITSHFAETREQKERLMEIATMLEESLEGHTCAAMKGLIKEGSEILEEKYETAGLKDIMIVAAAQRVEHYEIAGYGNAIALADYLGMEEIVALLELSIEEEGEADSALTQLCQEVLFDSCDAIEDEDLDGSEKEGRV